MSTPFRASPGYAPVGQGLDLLDLSGDISSSTSAMPILAWKHILNSTHNTLPGFNMRQACIQLKSILFRLLPAMSYPRQDILCDTTVTAESSRDIRATHFYCGPDWHTDRRGDPLSLLQGLPAQVRPSPMKPGLQLQPKLPLLSVQKPLTLSQLWTPVAHSSISEEKETVALISSSPIEWNYATSVV